MVFDKVIFLILQGEQRAKKSQNIPEAAEPSKGQVTQPSSGVPVNRAGSIGAEIDTEMNETQRDLETNPAYMEASIYGILLKSFGENQFIYLRKK